jgi:uncharacterized protein (TIGR02266 family)
MSDEPRKSPREKFLGLNVRYKSASVDDFIENHAVDIGRGGFFVKTPKPFALGTLVKFEIKIASDESVLSGVGCVVWRRELEPGAVAVPGKAAGMGVKFLKLEPGARSVLERLLTTKANAGKSYESEPEGALPPGIAVDASLNASAPTAKAPTAPSVVPQAPSVVPAAPSVIPASPSKVAPATSAKDRALPPSIPRSPSVPLFPEDRPLAEAAPPSVARPATSATAALRDARLGDSRRRTEESVAGPRPAAPGSGSIAPKPAIPALAPKFSATGIAAVDPSAPRATFAARRGSLGATPPPPGAIGMTSRGTSPPSSNLRSAPVVDPLTKTAESPQAVDEALRADAESAELFEKAAAPMSARPTPVVGTPVASSSASSSATSMFFPASSGPSEPVVEPTMMKQASELLEEALKEAGGDVAEIANNPLAVGPRNVDTVPPVRPRAPSLPQVADVAPPLVGSATVPARPEAPYQPVPTVSVRAVTVPDEPSNTVRNIVIFVAVAAVVAAVAFIVLRNERPPVASVVPPAGSALPSASASNDLLKLAPPSGASAQPTPSADPAKPAPPIDLDAPKPTESAPKMGTAPTFAKPTAVAPLPEFPAKPVEPNPGIPKPVETKPVEPKPVETAKPPAAGPGDMDLK